jgi:hypothetical protein
LNRRCGLSLSSVLLRALDVILSHKNERTPKVKKTPPAARNTGNSMLWKASPYSTMASGTWRVEARLADDVLIVEEQNHSWEEFLLEHIAYVVG